MPDADPYAAFASPVQAPPPQAGGQADPYAAFSKPLQAATSPPGGADPYAAFSRPVQQPANMADQVPQITGLQNLHQIQAQQAGQLQQAQQQEAQQRGFLGNMVVGVLHPAGALFGRLEQALAPVAGAIGGPEAAIRQQEAGNTLLSTPSAGVGGFAGNLAGALPLMANPLTAGAFGASEAGEGVTQARARGQQISGGAAALDVAGQAVLQATLAKLFGNNITGGIAKTVEAKLAPMLPGLLAKYGARAYAGAALNAGQSIASDLLSKGTVNPNLTLGEAAQHAGESALTGAGLETGLGAIHDVLGPKAPPVGQTQGETPTEQTQPPSPAGGAERPAPGERGNPTAEQATLDAATKERELAQARGGFVERRSPNFQAAWEGVERRNPPKVGEEEPRPTLPPESKDWDAGKLIDWAGQNGITTHITPGDQPLADRVRDNIESQLTDQYGEQLARKRNLAMSNLIAREHPEVKPIEPEPAKGPTEQAPVTPEIKTPQVTPQVETKPGERSGGPLAGLIEKDIKPGVGAFARGTVETLEGTRRALGVHRGAESIEDAFRQRGAQAARLRDQLDQNFAADSKEMGNLNEKQLETVRDRYEQSQPQGNDTHERIMERVRDEYTKMQAARVAVDPAAADREVENYLARRYENPEKALPIVQQILAKKPLGGPNNAKYGRSFEFESEARKAGLRLAETNPVEAMKNEWDETNRWVSAMKLIQDKKANGTILPIPGEGKGKTPAGYSSLSMLDPMTRGLMAKDEDASVINNALSSGLGKYAVFRGARQVGNLMNQANLGLSLRHGEMTLNTAAVSKAAEAWKSLARGDPKDFAGKLFNSLTQIGPASEIPKKAALIENEWHNPGTGTPEVQAITGALERQGGRVKQDPYYATHVADNMMKAAKEGDWARAIPRAPVAAFEHLMDPIMKGLVPHGKLAAYYDMGMNLIKDNPELAKDPTGKTLDQAMKTSGYHNGWDEIDNRYGLVAYDNQFMHRTMKDVFMLGMRALGWRGGSLKSLLGGTMDLATVTGRGLAHGEMKLSDRSAFVLGQVTQTAFRGALLTYLMTGRGPQSLHDYIWPPTGQRDKNGNMARITYPGYHNDIASLANNPKTYLTSGIHPLAEGVMDLLNNKDFYGNKIAQEDDSTWKQWAERIKFLGKQAEPFALQYLQKGNNTAQALTGIVRAPAYATESSAEQKADEYLGGQAPVGGRTEKNAARIKAMETIANAYRDHAPDAQQQYNQAVQAKTISRSDFKEIQTWSHGPVGLQGKIKRIEDPHQLMQVWGEMTPEQQQQNRFEVRGKIIRSKIIGDDERRQYLQETQAHATATAQ